MTRLGGVFTSTIRRRILTSFAVIILLVLTVTLAGYYQLSQVEILSERLIPNSSQTGLLQDFALAVSSLDANLERYFVIGGEQFRDNIQDNLAAIETALAAMRENSSPETLPAISRLAGVSSTLTEDVLALLDVQSTAPSSREVNERIISVYTQIDRVEALHQQISQNTLSQLQTTVLTQQQITSRVIWQFAVLGLAVFLIAVLSSLFVTRSIGTPLASLAETASQIAAGDLQRTADIEREDEIGILANSFNVMTVQLRQMIGSLEQQVADRTADLERRSAYLEASAVVGRAAASILDSDELIRQVVDLIRERFGLYFVGLFMLEEAGAGSQERWAALRAGTGPAGRAMMARGHRIQAGEGMIGWSIAHDQPRVALQAGEDAVRLPTAELPETRSEAALPLRSRGQVIGALSVQHTQPNAFDPATLAVLQLMADQVAVAVDNARLFAQSQAALDAERRAYGEISRQAWADMIHRRASLGYVCSQEGVVRPAPLASRALPFSTDDRGPSRGPGASSTRPQPESLVSGSEATAGAHRTAGSPAETGREGADSSTGAMFLPIRIRDHQVGAIRLRKQVGAGNWTAEERVLMQTLTEQLEVALESARLYQDTQHRAIRDRLMAEIVGRIRETLEVDAVLRTAALEIRQSLGLPEVAVRLTGQPEDLELNGADVDDF